MVPSKPNKALSFASELLEQERLMSGPEYMAHRIKLVQLVNSARRRERFACWICAIAGVIGFSLLFIGGSGVVGSFDPWDEDANTLSIVLGVTFAVCQITFWVLLASYYSRFRPHTWRAREELRDWQLSQLSARVDALAEQVGVLTRASEEQEHSTTTEEPPKP